MYVHQGTPKHWVSDGTLINLFAYGEDTEAMGARRRRFNWSKGFDQRLRGSHQIDYAVYPHSGTWRSADAIDVARAYQTPPFGYTTTAASGTLRSQTSI